MLLLGKLFGKSGTFTVTGLNREYLLFSKQICQLSEHRAVATNISKRVLSNISWIRTFHCTSETTSCVTWFTNEEMLQSEDRRLIFFQHLIRFRTFFSFDTVKHYFSNRYSLKWLSAVLINMSGTLLISGE